MNSGLLLINKPAGVSSAAICSAIKRQFSGIKKIGHTGTLDPFATGLLVVCVNRATRVIPYITPCDKTYVFLARFGMQTDTLDPKGKIVETSGHDRVNSAALHSTCQRFIGTTMQTPPLYSALKKDGKPLYRYARLGIAVDVEAKRRPVKIDNLSCYGWSAPYALFRVTCSHGTYVRSLARDIAAMLDSTATLVGLTRTKNGQFDLEQALDLDQLDIKQHLISISDVLKDYPAITVTQAEAERIKHGNPVKINNNHPCQPLSDQVHSQPVFRVFDPDQTMISIAKLAEPNILAPVVNLT